MKNPNLLSTALRYGSNLALVLAALVSGTASKAAAPTVLFQDDFTGGIPGWFAVQPSYGAYIEGPMLWQYDRVSNAFFEQSNIYTETSGNPPSRVAVMLINNVNCPNSFTYTATVTSGDDDAFGLIFGYQNESTFYRLQFATQASRTTGWPYVGWCVDRMNDRAVTNIAVGIGPFLTTGVPQNVSITVTNDLGITKLTIPELGITDLVLPSSAGGKVGVFSWGQQTAGGGVRSFRIQNPVLAPVPLAGNPASEVLSNWSFDITLSSTNDTPTGSAPPNWSQALTASGDRGTMMENSDWTVENFVTSSTNTPVPVALAGDPNWSNYVFSARFTTADDDGFGMLLRYTDVTNWYRIAFRFQNSGAGIKRGTTIQKAVNRVFSQIHTNITFIPPLNTLIDVYASINTNRLQLAIVSAPTSLSPSNYYFGPFDITGGTVDKGKVGIFSWAQFSALTGTEVDSVKVSQLTGEGLLITSLYGTPNPPVGLNDFPIGSFVTAKVDQVVFPATGVRKTMTGFTGSGSAPANGTTNEISFNLSTLSSVVWKWRSDYLVTVSTTPGGTAGFLGSQYLPEGTNLTIIATNSPGYVFLGWSGSAASQKTNLSFTLSSPVTLVARFAADSDGDGLPDEWENANFGNLAQTATGDPDGDGRNNLLDYNELGTDPNFAEPAIFADGMTSQWINEFRDRAIPGWFVVTNFDTGFRGVWEASNQNEGTTTPGVSGANSAPNASFQGPTIVVRSNVWNDAWSRTNSMQVEYSVGDDDGSCLYFRYLNESNYYRVTIDGQTQTSISPLLGVTFQRRTNGFFSAVAPISDLGPLLYSDPLDGGGFKRYRVTVNSTNDIFEVHVAGWDRFLSPPDWNTNNEKVLTFQDSSFPTGRIGIGDWGMSTFGAWNATVDNPPTSVYNPVGAGVLIDNIIVTVDGANVFTENWESATLHTAFPANWENPYIASGVNSIAGDWHITADGSIGNLNNSFGSFHTGTAASPKQDGEGPILLVTPTTNGNYVLELGIQPGDDGGMGFVYDYIDTNNFARVMFDSQVPAANGELLQGLNVGRKSGGVWKDILVGDKTFIYTPGRSFDVRFANNNGVYTLVAWNSTAPATTFRWQWSDQSAQLTNRFGYAVWNMPDAHYTYLRASALHNQAATEFKITSISTSGPNLVLGVSKPLYSLYTVLRASNVNGPYLPVATNQNGLTYAEPLPGAPAFYRLQLQ